MMPRFAHATLKPRLMLAFNVLMGLTVLAVATYQTSLLSTDLAAAPMAQVIVALSALLIVMPIIIISEIAIASLVAIPVRKFKARRGQA